MTLSFDGLEALSPPPASLAALSPPTASLSPTAMSLGNPFAPAPRYDDDDDPATATYASADFGASYPDYAGYPNYGGSDTTTAQDDEYYEGGGGGAGAGGRGRGRGRGREDDADPYGEDEGRQRRSLPIAAQSHHRHLHHCHACGQLILGVAGGGLLEPDTRDGSRSASVSSGECRGFFFCFLVFVMREGVENGEERESVCVCV
jgi:hypothetical protein